MSTASISKSTLFSFFFFFISLTISGCDKTSETVSQADKNQQIVKLNQDNINSYARQIAKNYLSKQKALLDGYHAAKSKDDVYSFIDFRNSQWSEDYVALKQTYTQVFKLNKKFLAGQPSAPLFALYENLMYIGLDLKNGFLENDEARQQQALLAAEQERKMVIQIIQQLPAEQKTSQPIIIN